MALQSYCAYIWADARCRPELDPAGITGPGLRIALASAAKALRPCLLPLVDINVTAKTLAASLETHRRRAGGSYCYRGCILEAVAALSRFWSYTEGWRMRNLELPCQSHPEERAVCC